MSGVALTVGDRPETVGNVADATTGPLRTWAVDEEVIELVKLDRERHGKRYRSDLGSNVVGLYNVIRKRVASGGDGSVTKPQIIRDLYGREGDDAEKVEASVVRWLRLLERVGLIRCEVLTIGTGKSRGLRVELLDVAAAGARMGASRGCSSVGYSVSSGEAHSARRRRLPKKVQKAERVRPWCPRAGRGSTARFVDASHPQAAPAPTRPLFSSQISETPGASPSPLKGARGSSLNLHTGSNPNGRRQATWLGAHEDLERRDSDAEERADVQAAIRRSLNGSAGGRGRHGLLPAPQVDSWLASEEQRMAAVELLVGLTFPTYGQVADVFGLLRGPSLPHARQRWREVIESAARRYDRYALRLADVGQPPPAPTAMALVAQLARSGRGESIAVAGPELKQASLQLRRRWRELYPEQLEEKARKRRERRVRRYAAALERAGLRYRTGTVNREWAIPERALEEITRVNAEVADAYAQLGEL